MVWMFDVQDGFVSGNKNVTNTNKKSLYLYESGIEFSSLR